MKLFKDLPSQDTPITADSLNQIKDKLVVVSATEPTGDNREKVWMQKGKNLYNISNDTTGHYVAAEAGDLKSSSVSNTSEFIKVKANVTYVLSYNYSSLANTGARAYCFYDNRS